MFYAQEISALLLPVSFPEVCLCFRHAYCKEDNNLSTIKHFESIGRVITSSMQCSCKWWLGPTVLWAISTQFYIKQNDTIGCLTLMPKFGSTGWSFSVTFVSATLFPRLSGWPMFLYESGDWKNHTAELSRPKRCFKISIDGYIHTRIK